MSEANLDQKMAEQEAPQPTSEQAGSDSGVVINAASAMLLEARSRAGFTQKEVADQLFLTTSFIRYIDEGRFDKIPKPAFVKGYLRSYARVVELSGDEVVASFEASQLSSQDDIEIKDVTDEPMGSSTYTGPVFLTGAIGFAGVVIVTLLVWLFSGSDETPVTSADIQAEAISDEVEALQLPSRTITSTANDQQIGDVAEGTGEISSDYGGVSVTESSLSDSDSSIPAELMYEDEELAASFSSISVLPEELSEEQAGDVATDLSEGQSEQSATEQEITGGEDLATSQTVASLREIQRDQVTEGGVEITTISAGGDDELFFQFSDDCWVEVEDAEGVAIYGDLNRGGDALRITGVAPYSILLGKAPGVTLQFNGESVDVARYTTSDDTAKVRLGR